MTKKSLIELLNTTRDVASGQHMPEEEVMWSVPNDVSMADDSDIHKCKTPGSKFNIKITPKEVGGTVELPFEINIDKQKAIELENKIHDSLENILEPFFRKEALGLTDVPGSLYGGELLGFQGIPQNPGLKRDEGGDEETDYFGAASDVVNLPPKNKKYDSSEKINDIDNEFVEFLFQDEDLSSNLKSLSSTLTSMNKNIELCKLASIIKSIAD